METVDVRVTIFWCGETKQISVPVEVQSFEPGKRCARSIAAIKAAALMGIPFLDVLRIGTFEMLKEDKARLREMYGETPHPSPAATPSPQGEGFAGDGEDGGTGDPAPTEGGGQGSGRPTETREEASA